MMRFAIFKTMWWSLSRDRGSFIMAFALPPIVFIIFASIFSGSSGGQLNLSVAIYDARQSGESKRLIRALGESGNVTLRPKPVQDAQEVVRHRHRARSVPP